MTRNSNGNISRRAVLLRGTAFAAAAVAVSTVAVEPAMAAKLPKSEVGYQERPHGSQKCSNCALFQPPHSCKSVAGTIGPNSWCRIYRKA
jgi:hypothetical protein